MSGDLIARTDKMIEEFLAKAEFQPDPARKRLIFAMDATASRQPTWDLACQVQGQMFIEAGGTTASMFSWFTSVASVR
jgi:hypothetical protein